MSDDCHEHETFSSIERGETDVCVCARECARVMCVWLLVHRKHQEHLRVNA